MKYEEYFKNKLDTDKDFKKEYYAWNLDNLKIFIKNKLLLWTIKIRALLINTK